MALTMPKASQINFDLTNISDPIIRLNSGESGSADKDTGIVLERGSDTNVAIIYDESADTFAVINTSEDGTTSGNVSISSYAPVKLSNLIIADAGNIGSASDTDAIAISSGGVVTMNQIPVFSAGINVSGGTIAGTLATAAQGNVTSLGTLTTLTVDNIIINGTNIGHTSDTDAIAIASDGVVTFSQTPVFSSDITLTDDLYLDSDGSVIHFGDDGEVTLTHVHNQGLRMEDSDKLTFGAGDDMQLYHDGSNSYIDDGGTGSIFIRSGTTYIQNAAGSKTSIATNAGAGQDIYHNNTVKLTSTANGITVSGGIIIADAGNIGSASDTDAIAIAADGKTTFSQQATFSNGIKFPDSGTIDTATTTALITLLDDSVRIQNASTDDAQSMLQLYSTDSGSGSSPDMLFWRNSSSPADNDYIGKMIFMGENDADQSISYATQYAQIIDVTDGTEDSRFVFSALSNGSYGYWTMGSTGAGTGTLGITIPNGSYIGSGSDPDAIAIASNGVVTFTQAPVFPDGSIAIADLDIDGGTDIGEALADADLLIVDNGAGGTNRKVAMSRVKTYVGGGALDDISAGDSASTLATTAGNITIDAQEGDADIIFKGTDSSSDITALTLDMSEAGLAIFNSGIRLADGATIGVASSTSAITVASTGIVTFVDDILIKDGGTIGSASDADAIAISSGGVVTMNQIPVFSAGINVSGGTIAGTLATAAQTAITSVGTLTALQVDNININGNAITSTAGTDLTITPLAGQQIVLDGTIVIDAGVVTGATSITSTAFVGDITGDVTGNADTFTATANNSANETVYPVFVDGATGTQGAETDTGLTYNPSTGLLTSTGFSGNLTGTLQTAAQGNVTSLGTLTTLTVDNIIINGTTIGHTSDTDAISISSGGDVTLTKNLIINAQGDVRFADSDSSHYVAFQAANTIASNITWTLPAADGDEDQVLSTNGSGTLAWADAGSGGSSSGSSFPNSTVSTMPGSAGNYDLGKNTAQDTAETPFEAGGTDAFGVNLGTVYSMMDPAGTTTTVDLGTM